MWDMSFSAAPREALNFSSHDIGGFAEVVAARIEEEEVGAAMAESGLIIFAAAVDVDVSMRTGVLLVVQMKEDWDS